MNRAVRSMPFEQVVRLPRDRFTDKCLTRLQEQLFATDNRLQFHFSRKEGIHLDSTPCGVIHHRETRLDINDKHVTIILSGTLIAEHRDTVGRWIKNRESFTAIPMVFSNNLDTGIMELKCLKNPVIRHVPTPPKPMVNPGRRTPYVTQQTYLEYLTQLDIKEGRITDPKQPPS